MESGRGGGNARKRERERERGTFRLVYYGTNQSINQSEERKERERERERKLLFFSETLNKWETLGRRESASSSLNSSCVL